MMSLQGQAYANVRDVLAPLFCNGRSFSSLIDELCKHFKLDTPASGQDAAGGLEAGSESQSTDSEAEGNISDETDYRRIQARVSAQARCHRARASPSSAKPPFPTTTPDPSTSLSPATVDCADVDGKSANASISYRTRPAPGVRMATRDAFEAAAPLTRKTRSRSQQQQRQRRPRTGSSATPTLDASTAEPSPALASSRPKGASGAPRGKARSHHTAETESKAGGGAASNGCTGKGSSARGGGEGANHDRSQPCEPTAEETPVGEGTSGGARRTGGFNSTKASISGDTLTVLSVTSSGSGWSEVVSAALAARARAGCVFAEEVDADSPQGSDSVREVFWSEKSRTLKALEVRTRLIPASQKVLLCSAWVDSGEYLEAAARLVALCQAEIYGIACVRFEQNPSTQGLWDRFNLFAKSMPRGTVPSLNTGVRKRGLGATLGKGLYPVYRGSGSPGAACANGGRSSGDGCGGTRVPAEVGANSAKVNGFSSATRQVSARAKRIRGADVEHDADAVASCPPLLIEAAVTPATNPEPMGEGKGGLSCPTGVSAGDGLAQPGDGGEPAQRSTEGGEGEGTYSDGGDGGSTRGRRQTHLISGVTFGGEEGDYAADSELSTDYETMHINGGGGRESDDHDMSEREQIQRSRRGHGLASMGAVSQPGTSSIVEARAGDKGYDGDSSTRKRNVGKVSSRERAAKSKRLRSGGSGSTERGRKSDGRDMRAADDGGTRGESGRRGAPSASHSSGAKGEDKNSKRENSEASKSVGVGVGLASTGATLEWKAKLGRQPIFMSRGRAEKDPSLELGRTDERARGVSVGISRSAQDPEDDRDRASSWSSADCPVPSATRGVPGGILRLDARNGGSNGAGKMAGVTISHPVFATEGLDRGAESRPPSDTTGRDEAPPNGPGGVIPWYNTSVYEANDPTEDRHAELAHEALGVRIYCVCDGHGGSRAAQFVCDHLAADVLARVVAMAPAAPKRRSNESVAIGSGNGISSGKKYEGTAWTADEERVICSLREAFASCDQSFIAQLDPKKNRGYINAGCCVVLALFICSKLYVAHVGDCRVVLGTTDAARFPRDLLRPLSTPRNSGAAKMDSGGKAVSSPVATTAGAPAAGEVEAVALSRDHNCNDVDEIALVRARSGDGNAIRVSKNDERKGARAIKRVAGSLAVTRAIGDAYLKEAVFSFSPYKEGVPYITSEPVVTSLELTSKDRFLILATDGVWEQVSNTEAVDCVSATLSFSSPATSAARGSPVSSPAKSRRQRSTAGRSPAGGKTDRRLTTGSDALVNYALERSAQGRGMSVTALKALPRGPLRRTLHDDMCATVVHFSPPPSGARGRAAPA